MSLRDYDRLTPKERREKGPTCEHGVRWTATQSCTQCLVDVYAGKKKLADLPKVYDVPLIELPETAARAQDQKQASGEACQDNSVDAGVTDTRVSWSREQVERFVEVWCRLLPPAEALEVAEQTYWEDWISKDCMMRILNEPR